MMGIVIRSIFPVVAVEDIDACRDFYRDVLGLELVFECGWYTSLVVPGDHTNQIAFVLAGHPSVPNGYAPAAEGNHVCSTTHPCLPWVPTGQQLIAQAAHSIPAWCL